MNYFTHLAERTFVWIGGALFVLALALTSWFYAMTFGVTRPWAGWNAVVSNVAVFLVFALHHSLFARERVKNAFARLVPQRLLRSVYVWIASLLLLIVGFLWTPIGGEVYRASGWAVVLSGIVQLTGVWLIGRSVGAIDGLDLAGIRATTRGDGLQVRGPYHFVRHPLYLGWMLIVFGTSHMTGDRLTFAVVTSLYLVMAIPWEERSLENGFGEAYARYKQHVRWRVIPFVY